MKKNMITIYTTPTCKYCKDVKAFLKKNDIGYVEKDVAADEKSKEEMMSISGSMSVPLTVIGDDAVLGFDEVKLKELCEQNGFLKPENAGAEV